MPYDIYTFSQNLAQFGTQSRNKFDVAITLPHLIQEWGKNTEEYRYITQFKNDICSMRASNCTTPGAGFLTNQTNKLGVGPLIKQPYNAAFRDMKISFIADSQGIIEQFFQLWMNLTYGYQDDSQATYFTNYRDNIVSNIITINKYGRSKKSSEDGIILQYEIYNAIPTYMVSGDLDWKAQNEINDVIMSFHYTGYTIKKP